jgi:hypothetical protein
MPRRQVVFLFFLFFLLQGCPSLDESGYEPDKMLYIENKTQDTLRVKFHRRISPPSSSDQFLNDNDVRFLYNDLMSNLNLRIIPPLEKKDLVLTASERLKNNKLGDHYFFIPFDTLLNYTQETWDRKAGVKYYYLSGYEDYQRINFTFEYP